MRRVLDLWPWLPREGQRPVPVAVLLAILVLAAGLFLLFV
jgi:hypothetical protein